MIEIEAILEDDGTLRACKALGHSGSNKIGYDIVCSAVSVLMRTAIKTLSKRKGITVQGGAPERGHVWLKTDYEAEGKDYLFAVGEFLIDGLKSVAQEYPNYCKVNITSWRT